MGNPLTNATPSLSSTISRMALEDEAPKSAPEWPSFLENGDDDSYGAAMRAADALFSRPASEPDRSEEREGPSDIVAAGPPRRILQSLNEDDHIARLLAEEAEDRPKRGRRPREPSDALSVPDDDVLEAEVVAPVAPAPTVALTAPADAELIPGYVRGEIFARYARHTQARPGEQWRKHGVKPRW